VTTRRAFLGTVTGVLLAAPLAAEGQVVGLAWGPMGLFIEGNMNVLRQR